MDSLCKCCGICCKLIPVKTGENIVVRDGFQVITAEFLNLLKPISIEEAEGINLDYVKKIQEVFHAVQFYTCKALSEDNKCSLNKMPAFCDKFPATPLAIIPDECGYLGEVFIKNEDLKHRIRQIKEEILDYETKILSGDKDSSSYKKIVENLKKFVKKYKDFGAEDW